MSKKNYKGKVHSDKSVQSVQTGVEEQKKETINSGKKNWSVILEKPGAEHIKYARQLILLVSLIGALVYLRTVTFEFTLDDLIYAGSNEAVNEGVSRPGDIFRYGSLNFFTPAPMNSGTWRPVTLLTFAIEKDLSGEFNPVTGHVINVILYILVLVFVGLMVMKLFDRKKIPLIVSLLVLMIFALHPVHTEVVASIKSRDTLLCALFAFLALYTIPSTKWSASGAIGAGLLFLVSLLS